MFTIKRPIKPVQRSKWVLFKYSFFVFLAAFMVIGPFATPASAAGQAATTMDANIKKVLYKNALATCFAYSHLRDGSTAFAKDNISESNAANFKWFNDVPVGNQLIPLDVMAGVYLKPTTNSAGKVPCSDPNFIAAAVAAVGYTAQAGDVNSVFKVMCDLGFKRSGGDGCLTGNGSWSRSNFQDSALNSVLKTPKLAAIKDLTDAELYWLGFTSFKTLCDVTFMEKGGAVITQGVTSIQKYEPNADGSFGSMKDMYAKLGDNRKPMGIMNVSETYTVGMHKKNTTNMPPGSVVAGEVVTGSLRFGGSSLGCDGLAKAVNQYAKAYEDWAKINAEDAAGNNNDTTAGTGEDGATSCAIQGIGWMVCPVLSFLADIADNAFKFLADNFLAVDNRLYASDSELAKVWGTMRNIGNVAFIIAFLFIIFSQLTGQGISNYGIKKLLPRVIIVAILVNLSYFICQIALDLSNILGVSLKQFFDSISGGLPTPGGAAGDESGNWAGIVVAVLAGTAIAWALGLSVLIPFLLAAVVAFAMVFIILVLRQVLIVLLVALSPIAFVAFLLPNTEQWFTKWRKMFIGLLMVFPLIGLLFGAAGLASNIIKSSAYIPGDLDTGGWITQIVAAGVVAIPLFLLPSLLKKSLDSAGNIGGTLNKWGDKLSGGARNRAAGSGVIKSMGARKAEKRASIATGSYAGRNPLSKLRSRANSSINKSGVFNAATGGFGAQRVLAGQAQERKDSNEAMAMFGGDDKLIEQWALSGGDIGKTSGLDTAQMQQFKLMVNAGHAKKATSFLAAAQAMSDGGKGSTASITSALGNASRAGASATQVSGAWQGAQAAYRKSGRGDIVGEMGAHFGANGNTPPLTSADLGKANPAAVIASKEAGWKEVAPQTVHREGIDKVKNPEGYNSYVGHLNADRQNTANALAGYDKMEARARTAASSEILAAAQSHERREKGGVSTITNIQEAKTYFGVK